MFIQEVKCVHWRNLEKVELSLSDNFIVVQGENAQGKTNFLEALYFLARGRSFRHPKDHELVRWGETHAYLSAKVIDGSSYFLKEVSICPGQKKEWKINGHPSSGKKGIWLVGYFPSDGEIIDGPPQVRREFLDEAIGFIYPSHTTLTNQYDKLLVRRNLLLREHAGDELLNTYTEKLIAIGKKVVQGRLQYLKLYSQYLKDYYSRLGMNKASLRVRYQPARYEVTDELVLNLEKAFEAMREEEREREITLVGPHRDEIFFEKNTYEFRHFGSQGEKKSLALSIKLAEMSVIQLIKKCQVIVILDDVFSELDRYHRELLLTEVMSQGQVFVSITDENTSRERFGKKTVTTIQVCEGRLGEKSYNG